MKKILVTGGAGYIGSFVVRELLNKSFEPVILDNLSSGHREAVSGFQLEVVDLFSEKEKVRKLLFSNQFSGVIHMASYIQMGESVIDPAKYYRNNVIGFINLLDCMIEARVNNIVLSSSAGVYGKPVKLPIREDYRRKPFNPYGETKLIMEKILEYYRSAYDINFVGLRYFNAAGASIDGSIGEDHPQESHLIPNIIKRAISGDRVEIFGNDYNTPDGTNIRDYVHVIDLAFAHVLAMNYLFDGGKSDFFNVGLGRGYSNREIVVMVREVTKLPVEIVYKPRRPGDVDMLYASNEKIKEKLSWEPRYSLREIIETAYLWHKSHPDGYS